MMAPPRSRCPAPPQSQRGFTMVELMIVVVIMGIVVALALPSMQTAILSNKLSSYSQNFTASVGMAKSEAIKRNKAIKLCRTSDGTACASTGNFQQGWMVFQDTDNDGTVDSGEARLAYQEALSTDFAFTSDAYTLTFQPSGIGVTPATLVLCRHNPAGHVRRGINITGTGQFYVTRVTDSSCPTS
jgi:type IV fimbrial biogenesis protein FimT